MAATKWPHLSLFSLVCPVAPLLLSTPAPLGQRTSCQELGARTVTVSVAADVGCPCAPSPGHRASATTFIGHRPLSGGRRGRFSPVTPRFAASTLPCAAAKVQCWKEDPPLSEILGEGLLLPNSSSSQALESLELLLTHRVLLQIPAKVSSDPNAQLQTR